MNADWGTFAALVTPAGYCPSLGSVQQKSTGREKFPVDFVKKRLYFMGVQQRPGVLCI